jgi:hypothetical protein
LSPAAAVAAGSDPASGVADAFWAESPIAAPMIPTIMAANLKMRMMFSCLRSLCRPTGSAVALEAAERYQTRGANLNGNQPAPDFSISG